MTALAGFCLLSALFLAYRDLTEPAVRDVEVWLGFEVRGRAALLSAPIHWAIFAAGAWAFWTQRPWILPAAAAYAFYVAVSHVIWSEASPNGRGLPIGLLQGALFSIPALGFLRLQRRMRALRSPGSS
jgi:hypothetical protein